MTGGEIMLYALAGFCFLLGFVALLVQKIYIDGTTNQPTEIELPLIGKLKTNFPALAFVLIGAFVACFTWSKTSELGQEQWVITGSFQAPPGKAVKWEEGALALVPKSFEGAPEKGGGFQITAPIPKGKKFEEVFTELIYTNGAFTGRINVVEEYKKRMATPQQSLIKSAGDNYRDYSTVLVTDYE
jgi:hypothetical protein